MCHPKERALTQDLIDDDPFKYLKIDDTSILDSVEKRSPCPKCSKSRKYFCYTCYVPVVELADKLPTVKLPFKIDIIKHKHEIDGKSTAIHASILSQNDIHIYTYPNIPQYNLLDKTKIVLIFPSNNALSISELFNKHLTTEFEQPELEPLLKGYNRSTLLKNRIHRNETKINPTELNLASLPIERAVFIDSTWNQSAGIYKNPVLRELQCVVLQNRVSQFWRHQRDSPRWYLATIEAIHQFAVEMHINAWGFHPEYAGLEYIFYDLNTVLGKERMGEGSYNGQYDNLLYFFKYMHYKIHTIYCHKDLKAYKRPV